MKKKLASELYSMNYELATYSCADQLVESAALTFIVGGNTCSVLCSCFEHALFTSNMTVSVVCGLTVDGRLKVYHS